MNLRETSCFLRSSANQDFLHDERSEPTYCWPSRFAALFNSSATRKGEGDTSGSLGFHFRTRSSKRPGYDNSEFRVAVLTRKSGSRLEARSRLQLRQIHVSRYSTRLLLAQLQSAAGLW